jgi:hypothetical protein
MTAEENELRVLLERAVPQLPAPAQRLDRIRERVRRRRRRRMAGLSATVVAGVAAAGLLLPGGTAGTSPVGQGKAPPGAAPVSPAASLPSPTPTGSGPTTMSSRPPGTYRLVSFSDPPLTLRVPAAWHASTDHGLVFVASEPVGASKSVCRDPVSDYCTPLQRGLRQGGAMLVLQVQDDPGMAAKVRAGRPFSPLPLTKSCRVEDGSEELYVITADTHVSASTRVLIGRLCMAAPTGAQRHTAQDIVTTAWFG